MKKQWQKDILAEIAAELEALEEAGQGPKDVAELEKLTIAMTDKVGKLVWEKWMKERAQEASFSP